LAPAVPSPPQDAVRRAPEILSRTGSLPEVHHARVTQAVQGIAEAARQAQHDILWQIDLLARSERHSIEDLAREVPRLVGGAIATVRAAVQQTRLALQKSADAQIASIKNHQEHIGTDFAAVRQTVMADMHQHLQQSSAKLKQADTALQAAYGGDILKEARTAIEAIPDSGELHTIALKDDPAPKPQPVERPANIEQAGEDIDRGLRNAAGKNDLLVWTAQMRCLTSSSSRRKGSRRPRKQALRSSAARQAAPSSRASRSA
jgi:hypothetical protein